MHWPHTIHEKVAWWCFALENAIYPKSRFVFRMKSAYMRIYFSMGHFFFVPSATERPVEMNSSTRCSWRTKFKKKTFRWLTILEIYEKSRHKWFGLQLKIMKVVEICENCSNVLPNEATEWSHCRKKPLNIITASGSLVCLYFVLYQYDDWFWMNKMLRTSYNNQLVQNAW